MKKSIKVGSMFSGVGAFEQALNRLEVNYENVLAADMDKFVRITYLANYKEPKTYAENVYDVDGSEIEQLDLLMLSPPCQSFSLAGKRKGEDSANGVLFYNSHEFIQKNKPRFFIFENVKGLLSDNKGKTFGTWIDMLGGRSVNGNPVIFPREDSVPYHVYHQVLNAKHYGVPQNRERVFIIGIRDDVDNNFSFPKPFPLLKRLKDVLETEVDEKYYLSDVAVKRISTSKRGIGFKDEKTEVSNCLVCSYGNSETRRGRVGKGVAQTLDTACNQGVMIGAIRGRNPENPKRRVSGEPTEQMLEINKNGTSNALTTVQKDNVVIINVPEIVTVRKHQVDIDKLQSLLKRHKGRVYTINKIAENIGAKKTTVDHWFRTDKSFSIPDAEYWFKLKEYLKITDHSFDKSITEFEEKEGVFEKANRCYDEQGIAPTMTCVSADEKIFTNQRIRRLTPRECFRLMDFPDSFKMPCSNSQMYKQAGNSIVVNVLAQIINKLPIK